MKHLYPTQPGPGPLLFSLWLIACFLALPSARADTDSGLKEAARKKIARLLPASNTSNRLISRSLQVNVKREHQNWRFGSLVLVAPPDEGAYPQGWLFLAKGTPEGWRLGLEGGPTFQALLGEAPVDILSDGERRNFRSIGKMQSGRRLQMRLPFATGLSWVMSGGPHGWSGHDRPFSSLDFWGGDQIVRATRGGNAYSLCANDRGWIRIVHDNGYTTDYYHLWNNIIPGGAYLREGDFLGYTGTDVSCGGYASGRHVHFALRDGGGYIPLGGKEIGGWVFAEGTYAYQGTARHGSSLQGVNGSLYNYGSLDIDQAIVDAFGYSYINLRSGPGAEYSVLGQAMDGRIVTVICTGRGTPFTGRYGTTDVWNQLDNGMWISDAFTYTGTDDPVAIPCANFDGGVTDTR